MKNDYLEYFKLIFKQFNLNIKFIFSKPIFYISFILFLLSSLLIVSCIFPLYVASGYMIGLIIITTTGIIYGSIHQNWRKSTLYKNSRINKNDKSQIHLSTYLTIFIIEALVSIILLFFIYLFNQFNLLMVDWTFSTQTEKYAYELQYMDFFAYFWSVFWFFTVMFSFSFFIQKFFSDIKIYYVILFIICLMLLLFGAVLNDYFWRYKTIDQYGNPVSPYMPFMPDNAVYPGWFYWVSLFFPFYAPAQIGANIFDPSIVNIDGTTTIVDSTINKITWVTFQPLDSGNDAYKFDLVLIAPLFWTLFFGTIGSFIKNENNKY